MHDAQQFHSRIAEIIGEKHQEMAAHCAACRADQVILLYAKLPTVDPLPKRFDLGLWRFPRADLPKHTTRAGLLLQTCDEFSASGASPVIVLITDGDQERSLVVSVGSRGGSQDRAVP